MKTLKATARTRTVEMHDGSTVKVIKRKMRGYMRGCGQSGGEIGSAYSRTVWDCEALGISGATRLELEAALMGVEQSQHQESLPEWNLMQGAKEITVP